MAAILLSDGANSAGQTAPLDAAQRAASLGVPIHTIALGTAAGTVEVTDENGMPVTLEVPPDTATLQQIAETTGGTAFDAPTADELKVVYDDLESRVGWTNEEQEVTWIFAAAALLTVVAGGGPVRPLVRAPALASRRPRPAWSCAVSRPSARVSSGRCRRAGRRSRGCRSR